MKYFKNLLNKGENEERFWISIPKSVNSHDDFDKFMLDTIDFIHQNVNINSKYNQYV